METETDERQEMRMAKKDGRRQPRKSAFERLLDFELAVVVALALAFAVPQLFGYVPDVVMSESMEPEIPAGAVAMVDTNVAASDLEVGDVAVYEAAEGRQVMHRVAAIEGGAFTFKGDANAQPDAQAVDASQVVGRYAWHVPAVGWAYASFDANRVAWILTAVLANVAIWALSERSRRRMEREMAEQERRIRAEMEAQLAARLQGAPATAAPMMPEAAAIAGSETVAARGMDESSAEAGPEASPPNAGGGQMHIREHSIERTDDGCDDQCRR